MSPPPGPPRTAAPVIDERRNLALLFTDLTGSTAMSARMEPEDYAALVLEVRALVEAIVPRHGGDVARIDGDGALCLFGLGQEEDAGRRAAEAALDLHEAVAALDASLARPDLRISLHSGIHAGLVVLRSGDIVRGKFEVLGEPTNIARRLCEAAGPGGILVGEAALGADAAFFRTERREVVDLPGKARGVPALRLLGRVAAPSRFAARSRAGLTPFTGRGAELAALSDWLRSDRAAPLLLHGSPGIGKSRLLSEFLAVAEAGGWAVHPGACEAYPAARALQPVHQIAQSLGCEAGGLADALAALAGPVLLAIDDWQWADDASVQAVDGLLASAPAREGRLRLLLSSREGATRLIGERRTQRLALAELPPEDSARAIHALVRVSDPATARRIATAAGGSPLLLEELCHAWRRGELGLDGAHEQGAWLSLLVQSRAARLPDDQLRLLRLAAVIGLAVPGWLLAEVGGALAGAEHLAALAEADFLYAGADGATLEFKHGLTRDAIHAAIPLAERRALHAAVAEALLRAAARDGEGAFVEELAHHLAAGGDAARAFPYAVQAGDRALALGALDRAQAHYRAALDALARLGDNDQARQHHRRMVNKYGLACLVDPSPEQVPVLEGLAARMDALADPGGRTRSRYWLGTTLYGMGRCRDSVRALRRAADLARDSGDDAMAPMIAAKLSQSLYSAGDYVAGDALSQAAMAQLRADPAAHDPDALAYLMCCRGFHLADQGHFASADALFAEAEAMLGGRSPPMIASLASYRGAIELWRGDWAAAEAHAAVCVASCRNSGVRYQAMMSHAIAAYARWRASRDDAAIESMLATGHWFATAGSRHRTGLLHGWLAVVMAERGDLAEVRRHAARALGRVREGGDRLGEAMAWRAVARAEAQAGNGDRAAHALAMAARAAAHRQSRREEALGWLCEADLLRQSVQVERAGELASRARDAFAAMGMDWFADRADLLLNASR